jgi:predicted AAA+ superfamily ATPase
MRRDKLEDLIRWKNSGSRKPLIIRGARQAGKRGGLRNLAISIINRFYI